MGLPVIIQLTCPLFSGVKLKCIVATLRLAVAYAKNVSNLIIVIPSRSQFY